MMRFFIRLILILIIVACFYVMTNDKIPDYFWSEKETHNHWLPESKISLELKTKQPTEEPDDSLSLLQMLHETADELTNWLGEPIREDLTPYGYTWWIYQHDDAHLQFGLNDDNTIETIYARGVDIPLAHLQNIRSYEEVEQYLSFEETIHYQDQWSSYTFYLTNEDVQQRPLVHLGDGVFMQLYFDQFTSELSSLRILTGETLLQHIPYEVQYRGKLPEKPNLTDEQWLEIERGMEQQIFELTNWIRVEHALNPLEWEHELHEVAYHHSKDMAENSFFSHTSPNGEGLKERLAQTEIHYQAAGENIAAQYPDALSALEGWLNSEGHREALLAEQFTHIGVGVHRLYYTQNFITTP